MIRWLPFATVLLLPSLSTACAGQSGAPEPMTGRRTVNVMCNSTVTHDTGACQPRAEKECGGKARLAGVISSIEMTGRPTGRLYTITARYECDDA